MDAPPPPKRSCCLGCFATAAFVLAALFGWAVWKMRLPDDASIDARFAAHRAGLERVVALMQEDAPLMHVFAALDQKPEPESVISPSRLAEYRSALQAADAWGVHRWDDTRIALACDGFGWAGEGWRLAFVHSPEKPATEVQLASFADLRRRKIKQRAACRHLGGAWYAYLRW